MGSHLQDGHLYATEDPVKTISMSTFNSPDKTIKSKYTVSGDKTETMQFKNTKEMCDGLRLILGMPEMCDIKFLVGKNRTPVYAIKAILASRSRMFYNMIQSHKNIADVKSAAVAPKSTGMMAKLRHLKRRGFFSLKKTQKCEISPALSTALEIPVTEFEVDVFRRVILYIHSGSVNVDITSVVGVMTAAEVYGIPNLRKACFQLAIQFISMKTALPLLASTEPYSNFKSTGFFLTKILDFIAACANQILVLPEFQHLPKASALAILSRKDLQTAEERKWDAALQWSRQQCQFKEIRLLQETLSIFIPHIDFLKISPSKLKREILPMDVLPEEVLPQVLAVLFAPPKPPRSGQRKSL